MVSCTAIVLCHSTGRAQEAPDISWPSSPIGMVSCTGLALSHRTGGPHETTGHELAVVAYRVGAEKEEEEGSRGRAGGRKKERRRRDRKIIQLPHRGWRVNEKERRKEDTQLARPKPWKE